MKTVSLELAKTLKEKGYPQPNHEFWWVKDYPEQSDGENGRYLEHDGNLASESYKSESAIAAPTADEILDLLPQTTIEYGKGWFGVFSKGHDDGDENSLANALAKMWLYLREKNLLGVK